jgi:uncharacterized membrane protein YdjX (TVP38/TMEM64 family)
MKRLLILLGLAAAVGAFYALGLDDLLTLEFLKTKQAEFQELRAASPLAVAGAYFLIYTLVTAVSLPGAALLTLAGGALFGVVEGTLIVSFASSLGATLAFLGKACRTGSAPA